MQPIREQAVTFIIWTLENPVRVGAFLTVLAFTSAGVVALLNRYEEHHNGQPR